VTVLGENGLRLRLDPSMTTLITAYWDQAAQLAVPGRDAGVVEYRVQAPGVYRTRGQRRLGRTVRGQR